VFCGGEIIESHKSIKYCSKSCGEKHRRKLRSKPRYCLVCQKEINHAFKVGKYCSTACADAWNKNNPRYNRKCLCCGNEFKTNEYRKHYCSTECRSQSVKSKDRITNLRHNGFNGFIAKFNNKFGDKFEYVGGYINSDSSFEIKCRTCGDVFTRSGQVVRKDKALTCDKCVSIASEKNNAIKKLISIIRAEANKRKSEMVKEIKGLVKKILLRRTKCIECGKWFTTRNRSKHCSISCVKRSRNRKKEKRLTINGTADYSITLIKLVVRDGGKCHICGEKVDMKAGTNNDMYGSIDHVMPIAHGGLHQWSNVKLAHRGCNTYKRDRLTYESVEGQVCLCM
jgi:hypothetical protein